MKNSSRLLTTATITGCLTTAPCIPATFASTDVTNNDQGWIIHGSENSATPGGFSAVAEPAGPVDPEAAKRAAEEYARKCIEPKILAIASMGLIPGPPQECTVQVNTGTPLAAGPYHGQ